MALTHVMRRRPRPTATSGISRSSTKRAAAMKALKAPVIELSDGDEGYVSFNAEGNDGDALMSDNGNENDAEASDEEVDENGNLKGFIDDEAVEDDDEGDNDDEQQDAGIAEGGAGSAFDMTDEPAAGNEVEEVDIDMADKEEDEETMEVDERGSR